MEAHRQGFLNSGVLSESIDDTPKSNALQSVQSLIEEHYAYYYQMALSCNDGNLSAANNMLEMDVSEFFWAATQKLRYDKAVREASKNK